MGKNFFKGIIVLACFLLCTLAFCGCSVLGEIHIVHDFGEWETVIEPTCTESGKQESKCSGCDKPGVTAKNGIKSRRQEANCC